MRIEKPWGYEEILEQNEHYVVKLLFMRRDARCSLQYHEEKHETIYVLSGNLLVRKGDVSLECQTGDYVVIPPGTVHRMRGLTDSSYLETSTPQLDDVVRLEDAYGR